MTPQEHGNAMGAALRAAEDKAREEGATGTLALLTGTLHPAMKAAFQYARDDLGVDLDWDGVAGNTAAGKTGDAQVNEGGNKDE